VKGKRSGGKEKGTNGREGGGTERGRGKKGRWKGKGGMLCSRDFSRKKPDVQSNDTEATVCVQQSPNTTQLGR